MTLLSNTALKRIQKLAPQARIAICTGCNQVIFPGAWFRRRTVQHLRIWWHNHDAAFIYSAKDFLDTLKIVRH